MLTVSKGIFKDVQLALLICEENEILFRKVFLTVHHHSMLYFVQAPNIFLCTRFRCRHWTRLSNALKNINFVFPLIKFVSFVSYTCLLRVHLRFDLGFFPSTFINSLWL